MTFFLVLFLSPPLLLFPFCKARPSHRYLCPPPPTLGCEEFWLRREGVGWGHDGRDDGGLFEGHCLEEDDSVYLESRSHYTRFCSYFDKGKKGRSALVRSPNVSISKSDKEGVFSRAFLHHPEQFSSSVSLFPFLYLPVLRL